MLSSRFNELKHINNNSSGQKALNDYENDSICEHFWSRIHLANILALIQLMELEVA